MKYAKLLKIPNFRGIFMRDSLPTYPTKYECAIVNLDSNKGSGTHWVAYKKKGSSVDYFDSFGALKPPLELARYFRQCKIRYNYDPYQKYNTINCGHLCLEFLYKNSNAI